MSNLCNYLCFRLCNMRVASVHTLSYFYTTVFVLIIMALTTVRPSALVLPRPPQRILVRDPPVTSSDLPKQIPAPPSPGLTSTTHYEQQLPRLLWITSTAYPVYPQFT